MYDVDELLAEEIRPESVPAYYRQSLLGYLAVHDRRGAMHFALDGSNFGAQADLVRDSLEEVGARRALELASGTGFNAALLGAALPEIDFLGVDLMPAHVRLSRARTRRLPNVSFRVL